MQHHLKKVFTPLFVSSVMAGFPNTADDLVETPLDLNEYMIKNHASTYFVRVRGTSMINAGIYPEDILVVDRAIKPYDGAVVVAYLDGGFTVKRLSLSFGTPKLKAENNMYKEIDIGEGDLEIWGVVTHSIRHHT